MSTPADTPPDLGERLTLPSESARGFAEAEEELRRVRERFEQTGDAELQGELAAHALEQVERELALASEHRRALEGVELSLWSRRNRLERFLINTRGASWWHAHHSRGGARAPDGESAAASPPA
ncbi:MAG TPA: hypothetical protein VK761_06705 [Solirubrobacteraceae bacterium]|jgi:hypothetical protein|nr:hypothetical protein [Solirubrobacteraceae bacterium]